MLDRISELRRQAEDEISSAADLDALEELRVRHLGRKAELTSILRGIGDLPAEERGAAGAAGNEARQALEALLASRRDELESPTSTSGSPPTRSTSRSRAHPPLPAARATS